MHLQAASRAASALFIVARVEHTVRDAARAHVEDVQLELLGRPVSRLSMYSAAAGWSFAVMA
jgi:hypothetical protein